MRGLGEPDIVTVLSIRVRGREVRTVPLDETLALLAEALKEQQGDPEKAKAALVREFRKLMARV